jgi:hypothetical protein
MGELVSKFELLDPEGKQQLLDFLEFLLEKRKEEKFDYEAYRKRILTVGVWTDEEIAPLEEARQLVNNWKVQEW